MPRYGADLARIHDRGFGELARTAAAYVAEQLGDRREGPIVDLGCGSGITLAELAAVGHRTVGLDISPQMIELARRRLPEAELRVESFVDAELPEGSLAVLAIGEVVNYAFDRRAGLEAVAELAGRAHRALLPGGLLVLDSAGPGRGGPEGGTAGYRDHADWAILHRSREERDPARLIREITTFSRERDECWRRDHERHELLLLEPVEVLRVLREAGFAARRREGYADVRFAPGLDIFVATKPGTGAR